MCSLVKLGCCVLLATGVALATPVWNTAADLTGTRSVEAGELISGGDWAAGTIAWDISLFDASAGVWFYQYFFTDINQPGISHIILELSDGCGEETAGCIWEIDPSTGGIEYGSFASSGAGPPNPGMPISGIYGVKVNTPGGMDTLSMLSFYSDRSPVWGDVYLMGGGTSFIYNAGFGDRLSEDTSWYIARPDFVIPEPASFALLGTGLLALGLWQRRRRLNS